MFSTLDVVVINCLLSGGSLGYRSWWNK